MTDQKTSSYSLWAQWYDDLFPVKPEQVNFVESNQARGNRLLDVGCGTGNLLIALSGKEKESTGVDVDPEMIELAQKKSHDQNLTIRWETKSMTALPDLFHSNAIDTIICFGNTLVHAASLIEAQSILEEMFSILSPGGTLLLQIVNYERIFFYRLSQLPVIENPHIIFYRTYELQQPGETILFRTRLKIKTTAEEIEGVTPLSPLTYHDISSMIEASGFSSFSLYGDFKNSAFSPHDSPALVVVAKK